MLFSSAKKEESVKFHPYSVSIGPLWKSIFDHKDSGFKEGDVEIARKETLESDEPDDSVFFKELRFTFLNNSEPRTIYSNVDNNFMTEIDRRWRIFPACKNTNNQAKIYMRSGSAESPWIEMGIKKPFDESNHMPLTDDSHYVTLCYLPEEIFDIFNIAPNDFEGHLKKVDLIGPILKKYGLKIEHMPRFDVDIGREPLVLSNEYAHWIELRMI